MNLLSMLAGVGVLRLESTFAFWARDPCLSPGDQGVSLGELESEDIAALGPLSSCLPFPAVGQRDLGRAEAD